MIFQRIFLMTIFCIVYSKTHEKNIEEPLSNLKSENSDVVIEKERIIAELKTKILTRLNLDSSPKPQQPFDWTNIPEEMQDLLNQEVEVEETKTEFDEDKIDTIITPLIKVKSCKNNQFLNRECFKGTLPNLDIDEILIAKLIAPLRFDMETVFQNIIQYNITINDYKTAYNLIVSTKGKRNVEIDLLEMFKDLVSNDLNISKEANMTSLLINFDRFPDTLTISQLLDISQVVLEVQYKAPTVLKRSRRNTNMCEPNQYFCCTQTMRVDIAELGWSNFIVAPRSFTINYCKGDCNNYLDYSSNHAKALNLFRNRNINQRKETRSCCVPYSFSSLTIMYQSQENSLKVATFNDLIASSCGCL